MLLLHCDNLSMVKQLTSFKMVHPMELAMLRAELRAGNQDVDTGEEDEARFERVREEEEGRRISESVFNPENRLIRNVQKALFFQQLTN